MEEFSKLQFLRINNNNFNGKKQEMRPLMQLEISTMSVGRQT